MLWSQAWNKERQGRDRLGPRFGVKWPQALGNLLITYLYSAISLGRLWCDWVKHMHGSRVLSVPLPVTGPAL